MKWRENDQEKQAGGGTSVRTGTSDRAPNKFIQPSLDALVYEKRKMSKEKKDGQKNKTTTDYATKAGRNKDY